MPEGKDHSWNFVEIDSASDLIAMENPRQSRTHVESENGPARRRKMGDGDENATKNGFQARLNSTRSEGKEKFRALIRRKKGVRRRVKGRNKLARFDNNEETDDTGASVQEENRAGDVKSENGNGCNDEKEIVVMVKHSGPENESPQEVSKQDERAKNREEPFVSSLDDEDNEWDRVSGKAEERSYGDEGEVGRDYYPSGPRREQLLDNQRAFSTSSEEGD